jgi:two-component system, NtrC family, response regulator PilR
MVGKRSILIVDDEISVLQTLRMILEREGYRVTAVQSCAEALPRLKRGKFDAVITDLNMEADDIGFEVARAALKLKPRPAVIIYTGYGTPVNARTALELGVDYLAMKPLAVEDLISALNRLISRDRERRKLR